LDKESEIMLFAGKGMKLKTIALSQIGQDQKDKYCMFLLMCRNIYKTVMWHDCKRETTVDWWVGGGRKVRGLEVCVNIIEVHCVCVCVCKQHNGTHQKLLKRKQEEGAWLRKRNIDGMNLIKVHHMQIVNITIEPLC
jgi:hypothetical protein